MSKLAALIIARDPMTGALIGSLVEVSGFRAVFPAPAEDAARAITRLRPAIVLVDCDSGDDDLCREPVAEYGGVVILFSPSRTEPELRDIASTRGLRHFSLPIRWTDFRRLLHEATGSLEES